MPGTVLSMQNIYLVKKNYANPPEGDTKPPEDSASMKFVYHQLNSATLTRHYHATFEVQVDLIVGVRSVVAEALAATPSWAD